METSYFEYSDNHLMLSALSSSFWFHTFTPLSHANFNCPFVSSVILLGLHIGFLSATHISGRFSLTSAAGIGGHTAFPHLLPDRFSDMLSRCNHDQLYNPLEIPGTRTIPMVPAF
ncbi:MAG: hypothetical protein ACLR6B_08990 [Blautia sp.]